MERKISSGDESKGLSVPNVEHITDQAFQTYIQTGVLNMVPSARKEGYVRVIKSIEPISHFFPYAKVYPEHNREVQLAGKLKNLQRLGFMTIELSTNELGAKSKTKITPADDMVLGLSYLYGVNEIINLNIEKKKQMSTALEHVLPHWLGHPMGERIEDILRSLPGLRERMLSEAKSGYDDLKNENQQPSISYKDRQYRGMIPSLRSEELPENVGDLVEIFNKFKDAAVSRKLYNWSEYVTPATAEAVRFISAVNDGREKDFVTYDVNYSPRDFLRDINRVGTSILELEKKMRERGIDCNLTLGTVFELKKKTAEKRHQFTIK